MNDSHNDLSLDFDIAGFQVQSPQNFQTVSNSFPSTSDGSPVHSSRPPYDSAAILAYVKKLMPQMRLSLDVSNMWKPCQTVPTNTGTSLIVQTDQGAKASSILSATCQPQNHQSFSAPT